MNLILFPDRQDAYLLPPGDPRGKHLREVLRVKAGQQVLIGAVNGPQAWALVDETAGGGYALTPCWEPWTTPRPLTVLVGLPRPQTARRVLFEAACQGVTQLAFFQSIRGEPSYASSNLWKSGEWQRHLYQGAEQAAQTSIPEVHHFPSLREALEGLAFTGLALDVYEAVGPLSQMLAAAPREAGLAIGAERGWSAPERDELRGHGIRLAGLGQRVLKVETAFTAALSLLRAHRGEL